MHDNITVESIKADIISRLTVSNLDTREGSFISDMVSAVAYEIWTDLQAQNALVPIVYVDETSGSYIDKQCAWYGIERKPGTKATVQLLVSGTDGTTIPAGKVFLTADGYQFVTEISATIAGGSVTIIVAAAEVGAGYNVAAGTVTGQIRNMSGISAVTNPLAATGGTDAETDAALVSRLNAFRRNPATSGNVADYRRWALEVDGVGGVKVYPLWDGPGTVKVLIVGAQRGPVDSVIVGACTDHIEEMRPIGATVTVMSAAGLPVDVSAAVVINGSTTKQAVQEAFSAALEAYLQSISFERYTLVYNRIAYMLLDIPGVVDYTSLTVNGGVANISIDPDSVPVRGTVVIN